MAKPKSQRPKNSGSIAQQSSTPPPAFTAFDPDALLYAFVSLAVDRHRLRVYDTASNQCVAELTLHGPSVSAIAWSTVYLSADQTSSMPSKKRRKKDSSSATDRPLVQVLALGLSDGSIKLFSPKHGQVVQTLSHATSSAAISAIAHISHGPTPSICTASTDNVIRVWDPSENSITGCWRTDDLSPYSCIAISPSLPESDDELDILVANTSLKLLTLPKSDFSNDSVSTPSKPQQKASFTGHASPIRHIQWDASTDRVFTMAESDRFVQIWQIPDEDEVGQMVASISMESDVRSFAFSSQKQILAAISSSGILSLFPIPQELLASGKQKIPTLLPRSTARTKDGNVVIIDASFIADADRVRAATLLNGTRPTFDVVIFREDGEYMQASQDDPGNFIPDILIDNVPLTSSKEADTTPHVRYKEASSLHVRPGDDLAAGSDSDTPKNAADGDLDVDIAELSLGQRLTALTGEENQSSSDGEDADGSKVPKKHSQHTLSVVPASSLTRTLIQALHSSDSRLLETCLAHSSSELIRNTVKRLPPQLAEPLIKACVERLGRGARGADMKGRGGGASSQRGMTLNTWLRTVLAVHGGHLMTIPDLVARLSSFHATLTARLALNDSLLSLSGRLDMMLSQIEMRSSNTPAPLGLGGKGGKGALHKAKEAQRYVEGESEDEEDDDDDAEMNVDGEDDEEGSVEDVGLGGSDDDDEVDGEEDSDEEDDDEEDDSMNEFIDDEAEEEGSEEDDEDDED